MPTTPGSKFPCRAACLAVLLLVGVSGTLAALPPTVYLAHTAPYTGDRRRIGIGAGIEVAFAEANTNGDIPGTTVAVLRRDQGANAAATAISLIDSATPVLGVLGSAGDDASRDIHRAVSARGIPLVGAVSGLEELRRPYTKTALNLRLSDTDDISHLLTYLIVQRLFKRIAVAYEDSTMGNRGYAHIVRLLNSTGDEIVGETRFPVESTSFNVDGVFAHTRGAPQVVIVLASTAASAVGAIRAVDLHDKRSPTTHYASIAAFNIDEFAATLSPVSGDVFLVSVLPPPDDTTFRVVRRFRDQAGGVRASFDVLEGYLVGRMVVQALRNTKNADPVEFAQSFIDTSVFAIDDIRFGPLTEACSYYAAGTALCDCNQGAREYFMYKISSGAARLVTDEPRHQLPLAKCAHTNVIKSPIVFAQLAPSSGPLFVAGANFLRGARASFSFINNHGGINGRFILLKSYLYDPATTNLTTLGRQVAADLPLVSFVTNVGTEGLELGAPQLNTHERNPAVFPRPFKRDYVSLDAGVDAQMMAIFHYIVSKNLGNVHFVHANTEAAHQARYMYEMSANTFQIARTPSSLCMPDTNVFFTISEPNIIVWDNCYDQYLDYLNATGFPHPTRVYIFMRTFIEVFRQPALFASQAVVTRLHYPLIARFDQAGMQSQFATEFDTQLTAYEKATGATTPTERAYAYNGYATARAIENIMIRSSNNVTTSQEDFLFSWYKASLIVMDIVRYGPFYDYECDTPFELECECNTNSGRLSVTSLYTMQTGDTFGMGGHSYVPPFCRTIYLPLVPSAINFGLVAGAVAGALIVVVVIPLVVLSLYQRSRQRDNAAAPKDETKPFCVLFTDIQSSTSLWAGMPTIMAKALEAHHAEIRKLVRKHKCYEVKTIGDAFMIVCENPAPGVALALDIQRVFYKYAWGTTEIDEMYKGMVEQAYRDAEDHEREHLPPLLTGDEYEALWSGLRVRVGVHYGMGEIKYDTTTKGYDYYGTVVNTAARVESVCHGGQVGVSSEAFVVSENRVNDVVWTLKGECLLRGLFEPITIYQALPTNLSSRQFAPLRLDNASTLNENEGDDEDNKSDAGSLDGQSARLGLTNAHPDLAHTLSQDPAVQNEVFTVEQVINFHDASVEVLGGLLDVFPPDQAKKVMKEWCSKLSVPFLGMSRPKNQKQMRHGLVMRMLPSAMLVMTKGLYAGTGQRASSYRILRKRQSPSTTPLRKSKSDGFTMNGPPLEE